MIQYVLKQLYILKEDDSEIKMIYAMLSHVKYTTRYLKISTLTGVSNTNFVMLMTSSTIVHVALLWQHTYNKHLSHSVRYWIYWRQWGLVISGL
jgi:hypothetical protein